MAGAQERTSDFVELSSTSIKVREHIARLNHKRNSTRVPHQFVDLRSGHRAAIDATRGRTARYLLR